MHVDGGIITLVRNTARSRGGHEVLGRHDRVQGLNVGRVTLIR